MDFGIIKENSMNNFYKIKETCRLCDTNLKITVQKTRLLKW